MTSGRSAITDLEQKYPFAPKSREFFDSVSLEDGLSSKDVLAQTEQRLLGALGRSKYEAHLSESIEFLSFFAAALIASQDQTLASSFARREGQRARALFAREGSSSKVTAMIECFGVPLVLSPGQSDAHSTYSIPFEGYLTLVSKYGLPNDPKWKLSRQRLSAGMVYFSDNLLDDLFGDCAEMAILEGVRGLKKAPFPKQLQQVRDMVLRYVPAPRVRQGKGYLYVEDLIKHPVTDGRHRLVWLVLAPYLVNVKRVSDEEAVDRIREFVAAGGGSHPMNRFVEYNVKRARRNGLLPPTYSTLKAEHPDIYWLLPKEVIASEEAKRNSGEKVK